MIQKLMARPNTSPTLTLLAGISWIFSKEAVLLMPPLLFMALRFLLAGLVLAGVGVAAATRGGRARAISKSV